MMLTLMHALGCICCTLVLAIAWQQYLFVNVHANLYDKHA